MSLASLGPGLGRLTDGPAVLTIGRGLTTMPLDATPPPLELTEEQVLFFRARRGHLAGPGAPDVAAAARAILGAQSQQLPPSLLALSLRTAGRPAATEVKERLLGPGCELVKTWGQRDTLHVYDPTDWADVVSARERWAPGGRRGVEPSEELLDTVRGILAEAGGKVTRKDLFEVLPASYVAEAAAKLGPGRPALQLAAGRPLWVLANRSEASLAVNLTSGRRRQPAWRSIRLPVAAGSQPGSRPDFRSPPAASLAVNPTSMWNSSFLDPIGKTSCDNHRRGRRSGDHRKGDIMILVTGSILARDDTVGELSLEHVQRSRQEPGCLSHAVHRDVEEPLRLIFVETWESREALAVHFRVPGSREFVAAAAKLAAGPPSLAVYDATPIELPMG